uniref:Uncharacterized protein n=1 Tax=Bionectria ochroleuca TaxID=29856 RepID=A0A8H7NJR5_BIOOC
MTSVQVTPDGLQPHPHGFVLEMGVLTPGLSNPSYRPPCPVGWKRGETTLGKELSYAFHLPLQEHPSQGYLGPLSESMVLVTLWLFIGENIIGAFKVSCLLEAPQAAVSTWGYD